MRLFHDSLHRLLRIHHPMLLGHHPSRHGQNSSKHSNIKQYSPSFSHLKVQERIRVNQREEDEDGSERTGYECDET